MAKNDQYEIPAIIRLDVRKGTMVLRFPGAPNTRMQVVGGQFLLQEKTKSEARDRVIYAAAGTGDRSLLGAVKAFLPRFGKMREEAASERDEDLD